MYQVLAWGGVRELLATVTTTHTEISDATLLQWKNKYRYLLITSINNSEGHSPAYRLYYLSFLTPSEEFYNFFAGTNVGNRTFGERASSDDWGIFTKGGTTASSQPNKWFTPEGTVKIYGFTF